MKIAISDKGGVGKTILAPILSRIFTESGCFVLAIDTDLVNLSPLNSSQQITNEAKKYL